MAVVIEHPGPQSSLKVDRAPTCPNLNIGLYVCGLSFACWLERKHAAVLWGEVASEARPLYSLLLDAKNIIGTAKLKQAT